MKDLTNMISGIMQSQNTVTELTIRINETKTNPKFAKNCDISLFIIKSLAYTIIESFHFPEKNTYTDANPFSIIIINILFPLFEIMFTIFLIQIAGPH